MTKVRNVTNQQQKTKKVSKKTKFKPEQHHETVKTLFEYLVAKYPAFQKQAKEVLDKVQIDKTMIVATIQDAEYHISDICKKIKLDFFSTSIVKSIIRRCLKERGLPQS